MLMDGVDFMDIIQIKLLNSSDRWLYILCNTRKRSDEGFFFLVGHAEQADVEGLFIEAERKKEGVSGVVRLKIGGKKVAIGGKGSHENGGKGVEKESKGQGR